MAKNYWNFVRSRAVGTTGQCAECFPIYVVAETVFSGMSNAVSLKSKLIVGAASYAGLGPAYEWSRGKCMDFVGIGKQSSELTIRTFDRLYCTAFNLAVSPLVYLLSGERSLKNIAIGTACSFGIGLLNGGYLGYALDASNELMGCSDPKKRPRLPKIISHLEPKVKKRIALESLIASITLGSMLYYYSGELRKAYVETRDWAKESYNEQVVPFVHNKISPPERMTDSVLESQVGKYDFHRKERCF